jgi:hypothetical protein
VFVFKLLPHLVNFLKNYFIIYLSKLIIKCSNFLKDALAREFESLSTGLESVMLPLHQASVFYYFKDLFISAPAGTRTLNILSDPWLKARCLTNFATSAYILCYTCAISIAPNVFVSFYFFLSGDGGFRDHNAQTFKLPLYR